VNAVPIAANARRIAVKMRAGDNDGAGGMKEACSMGCYDNSWSRMGSSFKRR
jgi:hypothetical protein